jgi:hypothetical protein
MRSGMIGGICAVVLLVHSGCGAKTVPVEGVVTLDGQPVAQATVTFISEDGSRTFSGQTDDNGRFTLQGSKGLGVEAGSYKVTVAKYRGALATPISLADAADPSKMSKDYVNQMKKYAEKGGGGRPGGPMPPMPGVGGVGGSAAKSDLPEVYANVATTPLRVTIPASGPVEIKLHKSGQ